MELTEEQRARIAANRQRAIELQKLRRPGLQLEAKADNSKFAPIRLPTPAASPAYVPARVPAPPPRPFFGSRPVAPSKTLVFPESSGSIAPTTPPFRKRLAEQSSTFHDGRAAKQLSTRSYQPHPIGNKENSASSSKPNPLEGYRPRVAIDFVVISETAIRVNFSPFHSAVTAIIRQLSSGLFSAQFKTWTIAFGDYKEFLRLLRSQTSIDCLVTELPKHVIQVFKEDIDGYKRTPALKPNLKGLNIESTLINVLYDYQRKGLAFGVEKEGRFLLADEMGLGKTLQALAVARAYSNEWPLLILSPASVKHAWKNTIQTFLSNVTDIHLIEKGSDKFPSGRTCNTVIIMGYELMVSKFKKVEELNIRVIIFDECHMLKNRAAKRTKCSQQLAGYALRCIMLSGTPAMSRPVELFSQLNIINPKIFTWTAYTNRYCAPRKLPYGMDYTGAENLEELGVILRRTCMLRRLKSEVLHDLPPKQRSLLYLSGKSLDDRMGQLKKLREECAKADKGQDVAVKKATLLEYYSLTGLAKADAVTEHIVDTYFYPEAPKRKLLVFAHHRSVLDTLTNRLMTAKISTIRIDGSTKSEDRALYCKRFQEEEDVQVAVLSITAAGTGITLTAASKVIFAELNWTPALMIQAEDRAHRVGQKDCVQVVYMYARNTADDDLWPKINQKLKVLQDVNLNNESFGGMRNTSVTLDSSFQAITDFFNHIKPDELDN